MCVGGSSLGKRVVATKVLGFDFLKERQLQKARSTAPQVFQPLTCDMLAPSAGSSRKRCVLSPLGMAYL